MAELQKDRITRSDFIGFGVLGGLLGAVLTIPPIAFVLSPIIKVDILGQSDVAEGWFEVGRISEVPASEPKAFQVDFPISQTYANEEIQKESVGVDNQEYEIANAVWVSWKSASHTGEGTQRPSFVDQGGDLTQEQAQEAGQQLNVLSSSCAHLGCPVRWLGDLEEFLCPCHGGIYDINGDYVAGPPPRGMYRFTHEVRQDGRLYIKHEFDGGPGSGKGPQLPYVV